MAKQKPTSKICKHCATEIPYEAKVCPNCRKKVKGGKLKWIILAIIIIIVIATIAGGGDDSEKKDSSPAQTQEKAEGTAENKESSEEKIEYTKYDCTELFDELKDNALKAEKAHNGEYVEISGYLANIDSDGSYIGIGAPEDNLDYLFEDIQCFITSDDQLDQIIEMKQGDKLTVRGQITSVGEVLGYGMNIAEIIEEK